ALEYLGAPRASAASGRPRTMQKARSARLMCRRLTLTPVCDRVALHALCGQEDGRAHCQGYPRCGPQGDDTQCDPGQGADKKGFGAWAENGADRRADKYGSEKLNDVVHGGPPIFFYVKSRGRHEQSPRRRPYRTAKV